MNQPSHSFAKIESYRGYLRFLARVQLGKGTNARFDPSDIVQQSMLQAYQAWDGFQGNSEAELIAWLRTILARTVAHAVRDAHAERRDINRERSIHAAIDASSCRLENFLADGQSSPSQQAVRREQAVIVAEAVEALSDQQREVILLRYWHGKTIAEIAEAMDKTPSAVAGLAHRGLKTLRESLG